MAFRGDEVEAGDKIADGEGIGRWAATVDCVEVRGRWTRKFSRSAERAAMMATAGQYHTTMRRLPRVHTGPFRVHTSSRKERITNTRSKLLVLNTAYLRRRRLMLWRALGDGPMPTATGKQEVKKKVAAKTTYPRESAVNFCINVALSAAGALAIA